MEASCQKMRLAFNQPKVCATWRFTQKGEIFSKKWGKVGKCGGNSVLLEILTEAEDDVKNGRVAPVRETFDDLRQMLGEE